MKSNDRLTQLASNLRQRAPGLAWWESTHYAPEKATKGFVAGIDHSEAMVQEARKHNIETIQAGRIDLKRGDVASLPYPDETFDKAFSIHSIYFWVKPLECLQELRRVLKPGGLLAVTIQPKDKWDELQQRESSLRTLYFSTDLVTMFDAAGFREVRVEACPEPDQFPANACSAENSSVMEVTPPNNVCC